MVASIKVTSEEGCATEFTVRVPFGTAHLPEKSIHSDSGAASSAIHAHAYVEEALRWLPDSAANAMLAHEVASAGAQPPETQARAKILLADDNADVRDYVRRLLGDRHDITAVADGEEALKRLEFSRPDLVLTDIMMPRVDGLRLIREIREHAEWRDLPIIVLSARAGAEDSVVGLAAGADDYLVKPFASRELIARVDGALKLAGLRRQMNEALRQSEARFRNMADHAPIMIWTTDPSGACTYLSRSWSEFTGQAVETGLGRGWLDVIHPDDREATAKTFFDSNRLHKAFNLETRFRTKAGDYRWVMGAAVPWLGTNDEFLGYIGSVIDITDRRLVEETQRRLNEILETKILEAVKKRELAEEKLLRAQKMEAVGKLTGGIAHDFNNLLQVIGGNLQLLQKDMAGNDKAEQRLRNAINGVSRGAKLASQLLAFGRRQPLAPKAVNLGRLVRGLDEILRRTLGEEIEIETVIAAGLWNTMVDPTHVENAILNLAINARDAMAGPGKLTIEVGNACLDDDYALEYEITAGQFVMLAVSDTGSGMRPEVMEQAFEPFFSTKPEGQGTGLGLSMVYGFVKQSGGHIKIYSEIGQGTTIRMYLPRIRQEEDRPVGSKHRAVAGGSETILVVEDDDDVSATVVEMLTDLGYRVLKAKDAQSAFAIIGSGVGIDLLFTDVVMPGPMRSTELARKTRELSPATAILFTSGYTDNAIVHGGRLDEGVELLSKPYARETLARKVRQVLKGHNQLNGATQSVEQSMPPIQFNSVNHSASTQSTRPAGQPLCVLAVEDDPLILMATTDMLEDMGLNVLQASSAKEALSKLAEKEVDVLMTDIGLPGMSGLELALEALSRQPALRVIFMTGHSVIDGQDDHEQLQSAILLTKPFDERGLAAAIRSAGAGAL